MEGVTIALITAVGSIVVALIQAVSTIRVARLKETPVPSPAVNKIAEPSKKTAVGQTWLVACSILVVSNLVWQMVMPWESPSIIHLGTIPWCTCLLAYFRPLRWSYVAGVVTLLSVISVFAYFILGYSYTDSDLSILALVFAVNAILATVIAYRNRNM